MAGAPGSAEVRKILARFSSEWGEAVEPVYKSVLAKIRAGIPVEEAVRTAWAEAGLSNEVVGSVSAAVERAGVLGAGGAVAIADKRAVRAALLGSQWTGDGVSVITRLRGIPAKQQRVVIDAIRSSVQQGEGVRALALSLSDNFFARAKIPLNAVAGDPLPQQLRLLVARARRAGIDPRLIEDARRFRDRYIYQLGGAFSDESKLRAAYSEVVKAIETGVAEKIDKAVDIAIRHKARYLGERIARTETARAHFEGWAGAQMADPDVVGFRFFLSNSHPEPDICDMQCGVDFGLGPGVYPKGQFPDYPFHPNCICEYESVYRGEVSGKFELSGAPAARFLRELPAAERAAVAGSRAAAEAVARSLKSALRELRGYNKPGPFRPVILPGMLKKSRK
jgi:hypothetical protein